MAWGAALALCGAWAQAGTYTYDANAAEEFRARDGLPNFFAKIKAVGPHALPAPLEATNWEVGTLMPITNAVLSAGWTPVDVDKDPVYCESRLRTHAMLRNAVKCDQAGASVTVKWNGTVVGISDIPYGEPSAIEAVVDGGKPIVAERVQREKTRHARFWYLPEQKPGEHTVTFTVKKLPAGQSFYMGQLLIVGAPSN